jgi:hypothetical protein
MHPDGIHIF